MKARAVVSVAVFCVSAVGAACAHDDRRAAIGAGGSQAHPTKEVVDALPSQYLAADPARGRAAVSLGPGAVGFVVERARIVAGRGAPKVAADEPDRVIHGAARIPARLGGGFLFWTDQDLFRAESFEGALRPIARLPESITNLAFAPRFLLVRTQNGERWTLSLPRGDRAAVEPLGVVDVEGLDDGRALAFNDQGAAFASTDGGAHWTDVTSHVKTSPTRVASVDGEVWLLESGGGAHRLEPGGGLTFFDKPPVEKSPELRPRDPRWRGADTPLRAAFRSGASLDDTTAIVVESGDVVKVDVRTGEIASVVAGRLPPDASCEAVHVPGDVLFACLARGGAGAFVVAHAASLEPVIEQSFGQAGHFFAGDDGGLAFSGSCSGAVSPPVHPACVRQPGGAWQEVDASALVADGGAADVQVARWVPRADGRAVALVAAPLAGIFDPRSGALVALAADAGEAVSRGGAPASLHHAKPPGRDLVVDTSWSFAPSGALRGWQRQGGSVEIAEDGRFTRSPWSFDVVAAGSRALGKTKEGRLFQSTDHGATWVEVAAPPAGPSAIELHACSSAGCDLGGFYRVGWAVRPPAPAAERAVVPPPPDVRRTKPLELSCRPVGEAQLKVLPRTDRSPEDLGLGSTRLPTPKEGRDDAAYLRAPILRAVVNPVHEVPSGDGANPSLRGMLSGFQTERSSDVIEVLGPNKNPVGLRRPLAFVPPFDPASPLKRATIAMSEVLAAGRALGMTNDELLGEDLTEQGVLVPVTPVDAAAASDLALHNPRGLVALVRANERVRVAVRPVQNDAAVVSGVALPGDEAAFLEIEASGVGHVFRIGPGGTTDLFDLSATLTDTEFYPANPDALAVGPRGELAVLRLGSGSDPASELDPALLLQPAMPAVALAPWSTLRPASDPECKADGGWRATLQVIAPWVRVTAPDLRVEDGPMLARVKWSSKRVCLEGIELHLPGVSLRGYRPSGLDAQPLQTWLIGRGGTFARVGIGEGIEWRQPFECSFAH